MDGRTERIALVTFLGYSVLAGGNAVGVRFSNQELDPFWGATLRFGLAALLMLTVMMVSGRRFPAGRALLGAALYGLLAYGGAFAFFFYALVEFGVRFRPDPLIDSATGDSSSCCDAAVGAPQQVIRRRSTPRGDRSGCHVGSHS